MVKDCLSLTNCFFLQVPAPICKSEKGAVTVLIIKVNHMNFSMLKKDAVSNFVLRSIFWIVKLQKGVKSSSAETLNFVTCEHGRYTYSTLVQVQIQ